MKKFAFLLLTIIIALGLGTIFLYTDTFILKEIDIESGWIKGEEILQAAELFEGQNLFYLNKVDIVKSIHQDYRVDEVEFKKIYPGKLLLRITPKKPYVLVSNKGQMLLLDDRGDLIAMDYEYDGLMIIKDFIIEETNLGENLVLKNEELFHTALDLVELCQQAEFKEMTIRQENGFLYLDLADGFRANFGKGSEIVKKFNNFYTIYQDLSEKNVNNGTINLTNPDAPTFLPFD
ncbi:MAG TPA: FtsQ-type POTRA domain-containing protein [Clostridia bacterium]|nr:FtsQ-type POTRA domain-containing protein [Clostridia bacterium]